MENKHASNGMAEEMIRAIAQLGATEYHYKTLVEKTNADLENGLVELETNESLLKGIAKLDEYRDDLTQAAELRRKLMLKLYEMFGGDKDLWCIVKHALIAEEQIFECWQASDDDPERLNMWIEANKISNKAVSRFLGAEITDCASCLSDFLKAGGNIGD